MNPQICEVEVYEIQTSEKVVISDNQICNNKENKWICILNQEFILKFIKGTADWVPIDFKKFYKKFTDL